MRGVGFCVAMLAVESMSLFSLACQQELTRSPTLDACSKQLSATLRSQLKNEFSAYRVVRVADYSKEDVESERQYHGGSECLAVASGDFDGDHTNDFALLLVSDAGHTLMVAARNPGPKGWKVEQLYDFGSEGPGRTYVNVLDPGEYEDMYSDAEGRQPGRVSQHASRHAGVIAGTIEASGIGFFYTGTRWVHLWLSD